MHACCSSKQELLGYYTSDMGIFFLPKLASLFEWQDFWKHDAVKFMSIKILVKMIYLFRIIYMCLCRISISKVSPYQKKTISSYAKLNFWINQPKHEVTLLNFHWWNVWKVDKLWFTTLQNILNAKLRHQRLIKMITIISHNPCVNFKSCSLYCGLGYCLDWPVRPQ